MMANPNENPVVFIDEEAEEVSILFARFLEEFEIDVDGLDSSSQASHQKEYIIQSQRLLKLGTRTLYVDLVHISEWNENLFQKILANYYRLMSYLNKGVQNFLKKIHPQEILHRKEYKGYTVCFYNHPRIVRLRDLKTPMIGQLMSLVATVTRTSEVRPELIKGVFLCNECNTIIPNVVQQFKYTQPTQCINRECGNTNKFKLLTEHPDCEIGDWQKVHIQENTEDIPAGSMPLHLDVILRNEMVEQSKAGDKFIFIGSLIVIPDVSTLLGPVSRHNISRNTTQNDGEGGIRGLKALGVRELHWKLCFLACTVQPLDQKWGSLHSFKEETIEDVVASLSEIERRDILQIKQASHLYNDLANSICPHVYGHLDIKRGILLMLFGGVHKVTHDNINLRGDINICIIGDPSTSKSQFLKYVSSFLPRAIYTSGKTSSAAGLTATVARDEESGEFGIEAGALLLADNSVCCIDEFHMMELNDQVAIHEAMEQQSISITKAGIQATLNARTSILAAANPLYGRYDLSKTLRQNINLSPPILSRFDLFFVILDEPDEVLDYNLAKFIVNVHKDLDAGIQTVYSTERLQRYIRFARTIKPEFTQESATLLQSLYVSLRQNDANSFTKTSYRITVRQLESLIRLSEALARLHCDEFIRPTYVKEASRLLKKSLVHVESEDINFDIENEEQTIPITISSYYYQQVSLLIIHYLSSQQRKGHEIISLNELINWFMSSYQEYELKEPEDMSEATRYQMLKAIINRMITQDILLSQEMTTEQNQEVDMISIHPNYNVFTS